MLANLTKQHTLLMHTPSLQSFRGMEARLYAYAKPASAFQQQTSTRTELMLYPFIKDVKTGKTKPVDEAPATLSIITNDLNKVLFNVDGWWSLCNEAGFPQFFDRFSIVDSTADYMKIKAGGRNFCILQVNDKPLFIPLTRKEFLAFLVTRNKHIAASFEQSIAETNKTIGASRAELKKPITEEMKKIHTLIIESSEKGLGTLRGNLASLYEETKQFERDIAGMTPEQAKTGAYIDHNKRGGYYQQLAAAGRRDGTALYKVNPAYHDKNKSASAAQLIIITYWYHTQFCPGWLQSYTKNLFAEIDYSRLKQEMR